MALVTPTRITKFSAAIATSAAAVMMLGAGALPATADTLPAPGCTTDCVATFDTVGIGFDFDVPANISELTVTIAGGAGAAPAQGFPNDPESVGGPGGAATIDLGTEWAGETLYFGVGGEGGATSVQGADFDLIALAGGGGQGGYAGRFDLPDQINGTFPGGAGASPTAAGVTNGEDATGFASDPANGLGGTNANGGAGGTGDANGTAGASISTITETSTTAALGGAGASTTVNDVDFAAGRGGDGITGGGGGGIVQFEIDENPLDFAAPGGGGSAFLALGLTGVAEDPNLGTGYVTFTYSLAAPAPTPAPALPATGSDLGGTAIWAALALLVVGGATVVAVSRRRSA
jgi:LPXTG-motif cell wall-anchored protein